jgi:formiminotetrahydrofolate cyclodeaminase
MNMDMEKVLNHLVAEFGGPDPLPAGGAAGVTAIAMGTALGKKVLRISGLLEDEAELTPLLAELVPHFRVDCDTFEGVLRAFQIARDDPERDRAIHSAWLAATEAPIHVAVLAARAIRALDRCKGRVKVSVQGDLESALCLIRAGHTIAENNARENAQRLDAQVAARVLSALA